MRVLAGAATGFANACTLTSAAFFRTFALADIAIYDSGAVAGITRGLSGAAALFVITGAAARVTGLTLIICAGAGTLMALAVVAGTIEVSVLASGAGALGLAGTVTVRTCLSSRSVASVAYAGAPAYRAAFFLCSFMMLMSIFRFRVVGVTRIVRVARVVWVTRIIRISGVVRVTRIVRVTRFIGITWVIRVARVILCLRDEIDSFIDVHARLQVHVMFLAGDPDFFFDIAEDRMGFLLGLGTVEDRYIYCAIILDEAFIDADADEVMHGIPVGLSAEVLDLGDLPGIIV